MKTEELNYTLPDDLIAQEPAPNRAESRLLVLNRDTGTIKEDIFGNIGEYFESGDCLTLNDTRVIRARLKAQKSTGGKLEIFLLRELGLGEWEALVRPSSRTKPGSKVVIGDSVNATILEQTQAGRRRIVFEDNDVLSVLQANGEIPLPPYIQRKAKEGLDTERYQTVYARAYGAVAAPTAGLHFTKELLSNLEEQGLARTTLTLHVGYGTFKPIQVDDVEAHAVDPEDFVFTKESAAVLNDTRANGKKVISVGTTATRVLESQHSEGRYQTGAGLTDCYIYPPHEFSGVDALVTNFHLPKSSLLALVYAFGGTDFVREAYAYAIDKKFRFYSYGDAMLIL
ncbi:tRNA preQ1(34) S-adenosylmethionine ribosyltransferase-isomerase QueA [bacterium AH-315-P07]|nr:tRNA preQ1(34) S-adenosylmethionine ribosyltransferase-isomerase QueA [bacterium AH-315-P07]